MLQHDPEKEGRQIAECPFFQLRAIRGKAGNFPSHSAQIAADQNEQRHLNDFYYIVNNSVLHMVPHQDVAHHHKQNGHALGGIYGKTAGFLIHK